MKKYKRFPVIMLALAMSVIMLLPACGGGDTAGGIQQNVAVGKRVFVEQDGAAYFGYKSVICKAELKDGEISGLSSIGAASADIYSLTIYKDALYISEADGLFRYPLDMFTDKSTGWNPEKILNYTESPGRDDFFEIFDDRIFFLHDGALCCAPADGGELTKAVENVRDFEVSDKGIYYLGESGAVVVMKPDLSESRKIGDMGSAKAFTVSGMDLVYNGGDHVMAFNVQKEESSEVKTEYKPHAACVPWSNGTNTLYFNADYKTLLAGEGDSDKEVGETSFPGKAFGYMYNDSLVFITGKYETLITYDLSGGGYSSFDILEGVRADLRENGYDSDPEPQPAPAAASDGYDVMTNFSRSTNSGGDIQYLYFNDFMLTLPNADDISYEAHGDSVDIIFVPGKNAGYGGKLVTIMAYDPDDKSYESKPDYHVAGTGRNSGKRFVAVYPTDQQVSSEFESVVIRYNELKDYLYKIGEGAVNSPLQTADSD